MKTIRRILTLLLVFSMALLLFSCGVPGSALSQEASPTPKPHAPFDGTTLDYEYWYEEGRDRDWEEDVLYLAETYLRLEPQLTEETLVYRSEGRNFYTDEFFNSELRESFIDEIGLLIPQISELSDIEILYELERIIAALDDVHSQVVLPIGNRFPINFVEMYVDDGVSLYVVTAPATEETLLWGKLESINDIPTDEILMRLGNYLTAETTYFKLQYYTSYAFIVWQDALAAIGVIERGASTAEFKVSFNDRTVVSAELSVCSAFEEDPQWTDMRMSAMGGLMYENSDQYYWEKYIPEKNMVYVKINQNRERSDLSYTSFWSEIMHAINNASEPPKVVFDLRGNPGGQYPSRGFDNFMASLNWAEKDGVYVIINNSVCSAAVRVAAQLRQKVEDTLLVGLPAGQPPNAFGGIAYYTLPNSGNSFTVSGSAFMSWPDYEGETLMPDIEVRPTIEDYKQGIDTILEAILTMDNE